MEPYRWHVWADTSVWQGKFSKHTVTHAHARVVVFCDSVGTNHADHISNATELLVCRLMSSTVKAKMLGWCTQAAVSAKLLPWQGLRSSPSNSKPSTAMMQRSLRT